MLLMVSLLGDVLVLWVLSMVLCFGFMIVVMGILVQMLDVGMYVGSAGRGCEDLSEGRIIIVSIIIVIIVLVQY